jgi:SAM-dependent methyltransferase
VGVVVGLGGRARDREGVVVSAPWPERSRRPASWLVDNADLLPGEGHALDVACGRGRHALWLAERGMTTLAIDRDADAVRELNDIAQERHLSLHAEVRDLEGDLEGRAGPIGPAAYDVIVVVHYLHRPLFPALIEALAPGGLLVYETFTRAQAARGKPTNPDFLLESGELIALVRPLSVIASREGDYDGRLVASVIARRESAA